MLNVPLVIYLMVLKTGMNVFSKILPPSPCGGDKSCGGGGSIVRVTPDCCLGTELTL